MSKLIDPGSPGATGPVAKASRRSRNPAIARPGDRNISDGRRVGGAIGPGRARPGQADPKSSWVSQCPQLSIGFVLPGMPLDQPLLGKIRPRYPGVDRVRFASSASPSPAGLQDFPSAPRGRSGSFYPAGLGNWRTIGNLTPNPPGVDRVRFTFGILMDQHMIQTPQNPQLSIGFVFPGLEPTGSGRSTFPRIGGWR